MLINIVEELKRRDLDSSNKYDLYTTYTCNRYTSEEKKKLAESLANGKSNKVIYNIIKREDLEAKTVGKAGDILFEDFKENEIKIGKKLNEDCCCSDSPIHFYGLFNYKIGNCAADDQLNLLNVCTAKSLCAAEDKLSPMCSEYVTEIYEEDYDNYFKGNNNLLDEGAIWDAIKSGAKGVKDAIKDKISPDNPKIAAAKEKRTQSAKNLYNSIVDVRAKKQAARNDAKYGKEMDKLRQQQAELDQLRSENDAAEAEKAAASADTGESKASEPAEKTVPTSANNTTTKDVTKASSELQATLDELSANGKLNDIKNLYLQARRAYDAAKKKVSQKASQEQPQQQTQQNTAEWTHINRDDNVDEGFEDMIKLRNINEEQEEQSYKVVYTTSKIVKAANPSAAVTDVKKEHEDATNVHVDTSYKPDEANESLTEDLDSDELADFGFNASIMDAINDEYETINKYNALLIALKQENREDVAKVIEDIIEEEYTHIGQLQAILETYSEASEAIEDGIEEAEEQLGIAEETSVDDDFGNNSGFDIFM